MVQFCYFRINLAKVCERYAVTTFETRTGFHIRRFSLSNVIILPMPASADSAGVWLVMSVFVSLFALPGPPIPCQCKLLTNGFQVRVSSRSHEPSDKQAFCMLAWRAVFTDPVATYRQRGHAQRHRNAPRIRLWFRTVEILNPLRGTPDPNPPENGSQAYRGEPRTKIAAK